MKPLVILPRPFSDLLLENTRLGQYEQIELMVDVSSYTPFVRKSLFKSSIMGSPAMV